MANPTNNSLLCSTKLCLAQLENLIAQVKVEPVTLNEAAKKLGCHPDLIRPLLLHGDTSQCAQLLETLMKSHDQSRIEQLNVTVDTLSPDQKKALALISESFLLQLNYVYETEDQPALLKRSAVAGQAVLNVLNMRGVDLGSLVQRDEQETGDTLKLKAVAFDHTKSFQKECARLVSECSARQLQEMALPATFSLPGLAHHDQAVHRSYINLIETALFEQGELALGGDHTVALRRAIKLSLRGADEVLGAGWETLVDTEIENIAPDGSSLCAAFDRLNTRLMTRINQVDSHLYNRFRELIQSYREFPDSRFGAENIQNNLQRLALKFVRAQSDNDSLAKQTFAFSLWGALTSREALKQFQTSLFEGYCPKPGKTVMRQLLGHPVLPERSGFAAPQLFVEKRPIQQQKLHASFFNWKNDLARQGVHQSSTNQAIEKMSDVSIAPKYKPDWSNGKRLRHVARALRDSAFSKQDSVNRGDIYFRANPIAANPSPLREAHQDFVQLIYQNAVSSGQEGIPEETQKLIQNLDQASNDLFMAKYVQVGFSMRKFDRAVRDQQNLFQKDLKINRPRARWFGLVKTESLQKHKNWRHRLLRYVAHWWTYGMPKSSSGRPSENAARLRFMEETSDAILAQLITSPNTQQLSTTSADAANACVHNLGFTDNSRKWSWGDLAAVGRLVFTAGADDVLAQRLHDNDTLNEFGYPAGVDDREKASAGSVLLTETIKYAGRSTQPSQRNPTPEEIERFKNLVTGIVVASVMNPENRQFYKRPQIGPNPPAVVDPRRPPLQNNSFNGIFTPVPNNNHGGFSYGSVQTNRVSIEALNGLVYQGAPNAARDQDNLPSSNIAESLLGYPLDLTPGLPATRFTQDVLIRLPMLNPAANANRLWTGHDAASRENLTRMVALRRYFVSLTQAVARGNIEVVKENLATVYANLIASNDQAEFDRVYNRMIEIRNGAPRELGLGQGDQFGTLVLGVGDQNIEQRTTWLLTNFDWGAVSNPNAA